MEDILKAVKAAINEAIGTNDIEVEVGKISPELLKELKAHNRRDDDLKELIEARLKLLALEVRDEFRPRTDALDSEHKEIWGRIFGELGIPKGAQESNHRVNVKTGRVVRVVEEPEAPEEPPFKFN